MATPSPVPSRAAIHALRGVIFTTSCSVVLLAEERRRRIKIARSAIENARKLHTVRISHAPALSEALAKRDTYRQEVLDECPLDPSTVPSRPTGPIRRRKREQRFDHESAGSQYFCEPTLVKDGHITAEHSTTGNNESLEKRWADWDAMRKEFSRISPGPFAHNELFRRISEDNQQVNNGQRRTATNRDNGSSTEPERTASVHPKPESARTETIHAEPQLQEGVGPAELDIFITPEHDNGPKNRSMADGQSRGNQESATKMTKPPRHSSTPPSQSGWLLASSILGKVIVGHWDQIQDDIFRLKEIEGVKSQLYQKVLARLTAIYSGEHASDEVDEFVRDLIEDKHMDLNHALAYLVVERHGRNQDMDSVIGWLEFCHENGLDMHDGFLGRISRSCREHWHFGVPDVRRLFARLRTIVPWFTTPRISKLSADGGLTILLGEDIHKKADITNCDAPLSERQAYRIMNTHAQNKDWEQILKIYESSSTEDVVNSSRCLRLAVVAHIKKENGSTMQATELLSNARDKGQDVNSALVPLLMARLQAGEWPETLIRGTLRASESIHDSVYNKAARQLIESGNSLGAITLCHVAARENGNGNLLYNEYGFANLANAYTCLNLYDDLMTLMSEFVSEVVSWHGNKICKETIKLIIKKVNTRANNTLGETQRYDGVRTYLERGLEHVKAVRASLTQDKGTLITGLENIFRVDGSADQHAEKSPADMHVLLAEANAVLATGRTITETMEISQPKSGVMPPRQGFDAKGERHKPSNNQLYDDKCTPYRKPGSR